MLGIEKRREGLDSQLGPQEVLNQINEDISRLNEENSQASLHLRHAILDLEAQFDELSTSDQEKYKPEIDALKKEMESLKLTGEVISEDYEKIQEIRDMLEKGMFDSNELFVSNEEMFLFAHENFDNEQILNQELKQKIMKTIKVYAENNGFKIQDGFTVKARITDKREFSIPKQFVNGISTEDELTFSFG